MAKRKKKKKKNCSKKINTFMNEKEKKYLKINPSISAGNTAFSKHGEIFGFQCNRV